MFESILYLLTEVPVTDVEALFGSSGREDGVVYSRGKNTQWYLLGDPPIGHAAMIKIGAGHKESSHYRFGRWWIHPTWRGTPKGALYAGTLIHHHLRHVMMSPYRTITLHAREALIPKYTANGWVPVKSFQGGFQRLRKIFAYNLQGQLLERRGMRFELCSHIIYPGDVHTTYLVQPLFT